MNMKNSKTGEAEDNLLTGNDVTEETGSEDRKETK